MTDRLQHWRSQLESWQRYQLPASFAPSFDDDKNGSSSPTSALAAAQEFTDDGNDKKSADGGGGGGIDVSTQEENVGPDVEAAFQRYQEARDRFLKRRRQHALYEQLSNGTTLGGSGGDNYMDHDDDDTTNNNYNEDAMERAEQLRNQFRRRFQEVDSQRLLLEQDFATFCERREELAEMINILDTEDLDDDGSGDDQDDDDSDVDEQILASEEERVQQLEIRKKECQAELQALQSESTRVASESTQTQLEINELLLQRGAVAVDKGTPFQEETVADMTVETDKMQRKLHELKEMSSWIDELSAVYQEWGGVSILAIDALLDERGGNVKTYLLILQLNNDDRYKLQIQMQTKPDSSHVLQVVHAKFVASSDNNEDYGTQPMLPSLDDLMDSLPFLQPLEKDLQFVVLEALARIRIIPLLADELTILFEEFPRVATTATAMPAVVGGAYNQITCSVGENVAAVLSLSPECPEKLGSVYLERILGLPDLVADQMKKSINAIMFKSPVSLMIALRDEITHLGVPANNNMTTS